MERKLLTEHEIASAQAGMSDWQIEPAKLSRRFVFANFADALSFVNEVGEIAESLDHHPDITFGWGYAEVSTTTHDRGGVTDFDLLLARRIDDLPVKNTI